MSQAENLLNSLAEEQETTSAQPINDFLIIDANGRITNVPSTEIILGVETDHNVERKYFKCPRIVGDNIDLTEFQLRVNFQNGNGDRDKYIIEDVTVDGDYITFSWLLSNKVLATKGNVLFTVQAVSVEDDGVVKNRWNTTLASGNVLETLIVDDLYDYEEEQVRDVLAQLLRIANDKNNETDDKYFDIDYDGLVSLKPEYRGATINAKYPYAISDNGVGVNGSKISELPQRLVIPSNINGELVTGFQKGMFCCNEQVEQIVLQKTIKDIPAGFCRLAIHLELVENTGQIETIGAGAFYATRIREMLLPNLKSIGGNAFYTCYCLLKVDLGNIITTLSQSAFQYCDNLQEVKGGSSIKTVNKYAFYSTRRLKHVEFLQNLTQIDTNAFVGCALDFEEVYPTLVANGCTFGTYATYKQFNDTDYWSGATFTPCRNELNSLFHQTDPRWANKTIGNYVDENGEPCTYANNGCAFCTLAEIYSAFEGVEFESPEEFLQILESKNLTHLDFRYRTGWCQIANELGYQTEYISTMTTADLQKVYDELSQGALVYRSLGVMNQPDGGHATLVYGVNSNGEMLMSETSMHCYDVGIYENHKSAWHVYKHGSKECDVVIVKKL